MCSMLLQDTDGTDATLTYPTVHLEVNTSLLKTRLQTSVSFYSCECIRVEDHQVNPEQHHLKRDTTSHTDLYSRTGLLH